MKRKALIQLVFGYTTATMGLALLGVGLYLPPVGVIDSTVLVAYGEVCTFAAGMIGVDYHYRYKQENPNKNEHYSGEA